MKRMVAAASPEAYVVALDSWRRTQVEALRAAVLDAGALEERIKWGHLVYLHAGPVLLIRAEEARVLFGFWRGARLRDVEPRLERGGKYEMATLTLREGDTLDPAIATRLAADAIALNTQFGDPTALGH